MKKETLVAKHKDKNGRWRSWTGSFYDKSRTDVIRFVQNNFAYTHSHLTFGLFKVLPDGHKFDDRFICLIDMGG